MKITEKAIWNVYSGILGALATFVAQKLITKVWELVTGEDPPDLNDPEAPLATACGGFAWVAHHLSYPSSSVVFAS